MRSLLDVPPTSSQARFSPAFGRRFLLTVDTEEEFDWDEPLSREKHGISHVADIADFQRFCEGEGVAPVYLLDWPIANSPLAAEILREPLAKGRAEIGLQLHPWVNPPFEEELGEANSFAGNLARALEDAKIRRLRAIIVEKFFCEPKIYRAGRYGVGKNTADLLGEYGIALDSSVRAKFDYSSLAGPDFMFHPLAPYWVDEKKSLLELPLTTMFWGPLRRQGDYLYPRLWRAPWMRGALARMGLLERIPLTPEGISVDEAIKAIDMALDDGLDLLVFSFHSPSLRPGNTPYVRNASDLVGFYDWWRRIFAYCEMRNVRPASIRDILHHVQR